MDTITILVVAIVILALVVGFALGVFYRKNGHEKELDVATQTAQGIIAQAKKEAERIKEEYENNIEELKKNSQEILDAYLEASEPVVKAEEKANEMISRAELLAKEIRLGSIEYAEDVLTTVEHNLKSILQEVERNRIELNPGK